jgi:hypothetical protein
MTAVDAGVEGQHVGALVHQRMAASRSRGGLNHSFSQITRTVAWG